MDRTKAMWHLINKKIGKAPENNHKLELRIRNKIISNHTEITEKLNMYFLSTVEELVNKMAIYLFILFPYIPFRYIPWKWKMSHSIYTVSGLEVYKNTCLCFST